MWLELENAHQLAGAENKARRAWANANRIPVEVDKKAEDRGRYLHPELFGGQAITSLAGARDRVHRRRLSTPIV
jgi:hypothetical protein